jgi:hypothetical protein
VAEYIRRVVDDEIDELMTGLTALAIEGPRAVGKTTTAAARAATIYRLDHEATRRAVRDDPEIVAIGPRPILIDEWQLVPTVWDVVRTEVDKGPGPGQFLLTGSAVPKVLPAHPGSARIASIRMRPMTLAERGVAVPAVSLGDLLSGRLPPLRGTTTVSTADYASEILASGFPGLRAMPARPLRAQLDGYVTRAIERDFAELGGETIRNRAGLRRWLRAYAGAISSTTSFEKIRDAATGGHDEKPAKTTVIRYLDVLERLWLIEPIPAWAPTNNRLRRLAQAPKHALVDPAIAARLLGTTVDTLLQGAPAGSLGPRDETLFGALFEALVAMDVRTYAQDHEAQVAHFRAWDGGREIDLIVERADGRVVAIEVKLARTVTDGHVRHLRWLHDRLGDGLLDAIVISTGPIAYRRPDGIGVVPLALLGA